MERGFSKILVAGKLLHRWGGEPWVFSPNFGQRKTRKGGKDRKEDKLLSKVFRASIQEMLEESS